MTDGDIESCSRALRQIGEETGIDIRLLIVDIESTTVCLLGWEVIGEEFGLEALGDVVFEFELGVEGVGGCPCLCQSEACGGRLLEGCRRGSDRGADIPVLLSEYFPSIFPPLSLTYIL